MANLLLIFGLLGFTSKALGSSCCGQSPASYTVLSMNQKLSLTAGLAYLRSYGRQGLVSQNQQGLRVWDDKTREVTATTLNVASAFAPFQQVFVNTSFLEGRYRDSAGEQSSADFSDTLLGYSYEVLSEYSFSYWKPMVFLSTFVNLPTGRSTYEMELSEGTDVTGHNQFGAGFGVTLRKVIFPVTLTLQARSLQLFSKTFGALEVSNFYDSSLAFLMNYSSQFWDSQFNLGFLLNHLSERKTRAFKGAPLESSDISQNWTVLVGVQKSISESWSAGLSYSDQTLLGPAQNSILNQSVSLNFNYNTF